MTDLPERSTRTARTTHGDPERLTYAEAGARLGISANAVRMRVVRGTLVSVRVNDRPFVLWPQPERAHEPNEMTARARRTAHESTVREGSALIAQLERENAFLRQQVDRQTHIIAGLIQRLPDTPELPAGDVPPPSSENASQGAIRAPQAGDQIKEASTPMMPVSDTLALGWRRWFRRISGGR
jgi:hypothetical protein